MRHSTGIGGNSRKPWNTGSTKTKFYNKKTLVKNNVENLSAQEISNLRNQRIQSSNWGPRLCSSFRSSTIRLDRKSRTQQNLDNHRSNQRGSLWPRAASEGGPQQICSSLELHIFEMSLKRLNVFEMLVHGFFAHRASDRVSPSSCTKAARFASSGPFSMLPFASGRLSVRPDENRITHVGILRRCGTWIFRFAALWPVDYPDLCSLNSAVNSRNLTVCLPKFAGRRLAKVRQCRSLKTTDRGDFCPRHEKGWRVQTDLWQAQKSNFERNPSARCSDCSI